MAAAKAAVSIDLSNKKIKLMENVELLKDLTGIEELFLNKNSLKHIGPFNPLHCEKLVWLEMTNNKLEEISNLEALVNLEYLSLRDNKIRKIENLHELKNLNSLHLGNNLISKIEGLDQLVALNHLNLNGNSITVIENLENLTELEGLDLGSNQLTRVENLTGQTKLDWLTISNNLIPNLNHVTKIEGLKKLFWDHNQLTSLDIATYADEETNEVLPVFPNLEIISLTYNKLTVSTEFEKLRKFTKLTEILVKGNTDAIETEAELQVALHGLLQNVEFFDGVTRRVIDDELNCNGAASS